MCPWRCACCCRAAASSCPVIPKSALEFPKPADAPERDDLFWFVQQKVEGPGGIALYDTVDYAYQQGTGAEANIITASPPFKGFDDTLVTMAGIIGTSPVLGSVAQPLVISPGLNTAAALVITDAAQVIKQQTLSFEGATLTCGWAVGFGVINDKPIALVGSGTSAGGAANPRGPEPAVERRRRGGALRTKPAKRC